LRNLPSLERKFAYLLLASVVAFFVYLIFNWTSEAPVGIKVRYRLLNQLTTISAKLKEPELKEEKIDDLSPAASPQQGHQSQVGLYCAIL